MTTPPIPGQPPMPPADLRTLSGTSVASELFSMFVVGWFVGLMLGGFLHHGIGALSPLRVENGRVERLDIEFNSASRTQSNSYVLLGTTDGGEPWRIVDEDAYRTLEAEGYPQSVEVGIAEWTGNAQRLIGETWSIDRQSTSSKIWLGAVLGLLTILGLATTFGIGTLHRSRWLGATTFAVAYFVVGAWSGERIFGWIVSA